MITRAAAKVRQGTGLDSPQHDDGAADGVTSDRITRRRALGALGAAAALLPLPSRAPAPATASAQPGATPPIGSALRAEILRAGRLAYYVHHTTPYAAPLQPIADFLDEHVDAGFAVQLAEYQELLVDHDFEYGLVLGFALALTRTGNPAGWPLRAIEAAGLPIDEEARESIEKYHADPAALAEQYDADAGMPLQWQDPLGIALREAVELVRQTPGWPGGGLPWDIARAIERKATVDPLTLARVQAAILAAAAEDAALLGSKGR